MNARQRKCERRQPKRRAKGTPPPKHHGCLTPEEHAELQRQKRMKKAFGHCPAKVVRRPMCAEPEGYEPAVPHPRDAIPVRVCGPLEPPAAWVAAAAREPSPYDAPPRKAGKHKQEEGA